MAAILTLSKREAFERDLVRRVRGNVSFDRVTLGIYATDASIYQIEPVAVVAPLDELDVREAVLVAAEYGVPLLPRGGGTSLGGQTVCAALVLDFSRYMHQVIEVNVEERWARVQPGVVRSELNMQLAQHRLQFAPDPATSTRANFGGMIGNNSSGTRSILYGKTVDHVIDARVLLTDGTVLELGELSPEQYRDRCGLATREGEILRGVRKLIEENRDEIEERYPKVMRRVMGYNLDEFTHTDRWNLAKLYCGSEGTLGTMLEARVKLEPLPNATTVCALQYADLLEAIRCVEKILPHGPSAVEILDRTVLRMARENLSIAPYADFIEGDPAAILIVEFYGDTPDHAATKAAGMIADIKGQGFGYAHPSFNDASGKEKIWKVRENGLGLMLGIKGDRKPTPFIEDAAVPVHVLAEYIDRVLKIIEEAGAPVAMYAHASVGLIHVRPILDLRHQDDIDRLNLISRRAFELVKEYGGSWCGEHGDGLVRSPYMEAFYGPKIYSAFKEVKRLFDPHNLMNPGKIVDAGPIDQNLRYGTAYEVKPFDAVYKYREDGSFHAAVEMCTGVGACRKSLVGTMCPSYMATRDEEHSTRGRANALRLSMSGQLGPDGMSSERVYEVLDLCLSCKGCKSECPSNVDVAKMKGEFLQIYHDRHGLSMRDRLIGGSADLAAWSSGWKAPIANWVQSSPFFKTLIEDKTGFDRRRSLPRYVREPFYKSFAKRANGKPGTEKRVVLFDDTYINYYEPHIGLSAVELLESCGYEVILARAGCCQRPKISHGLLRDAKKAGEKTLRNLDRYLEQGLQVVVVEPSCASALTDDLPDLVDDARLAERIEQNVFMIDVFLERELQAGRINCEFESTAEKILIHGHCHQKSLYGTRSMKSVLGSIPGVTVQEVDSGCCGMAGSFGYEKEHYDISLKIGEDRLFPAVRTRAEGTAVVACGFSCRHQIADGTGTKAVHWVETVRGKARGN